MKTARQTPSGQRADGKRMAEIYRAGEVLKREVVGEEYELTVRIPVGEAMRLGG